MAVSVDTVYQRVLALANKEQRGYITPQEFKVFEQVAVGKGFSMVSSTPMTRSSYHAGADFEKLKNNRKKLVKFVK